MPAAGDSLTVGLGEVKISRNAGEILVAYGLGSCVGVAMYDPIVRVAGMLHAVLPERLNGAEPNSAKYVDSGILGLLEEMIAAGADRKRLIVRMAGGANMLAAPAFKQLPNIGERNVAAAHKTLSALQLALKAKEVGGTMGRTMRLYPADGRVTLRSMGGQEREM